MSMVREFLKPGDVDEDRFERAKRIDWLDFDSIVKAKILMVGAGAIGNETGKDLVLSGFRDITVVDMDHIVSSNLARCLFFSDRDAEGKEMKARVVAEGMMVLGDDITVRPITSKVQELGEDFVSKFD
ncbi:MAG: ThiF family adenylyltransferase, partial [Thermoplasmata archaeon]|nr:ThiF family adenylyltransferase [Thermoplasmata archaeon]